MAAREHAVLVRPRTVFTVLAITLVVAAVVALVYVTWHVITWILIALFLALALNPAVEFFERRRVRRSLAAFLVFVLALLAIAALGFAFIPPLVDQITDFINALPGIVEDLTKGEGPLGFLERDYNIVERVREAIGDRGPGEVLGFTGPALAVARSLVTAVVGVVTIAFLTLFMLLEGRRWVAFALALVPERSRPRWERMAAGIYRTVGGYVTGNLLISLIAGVTSTVVLLATGVPYSVPLGLLVAILDLIPLAGATIAAVLVSTVAFVTEGTVRGVIIVVFFVIYQQVENHVLFPLVYSRTVRLSPLTVLISVLIGAELAGVLGALAAIPVVGSLTVIVNELLGARQEHALRAAAAKSGDASERGPP